MIIILMGDFVTMAENMRITYNGRKKDLRKKNEIQLYKDALYFYFISKGLSEFEAKIRALHQLARQ